MESMAKPNSGFIILPKEEKVQVLYPFQCSNHQHWTVLGDAPNLHITSGQMEVLVYGDWINPSENFSQDTDISQLVKDIKGHCNIVIVEPDRLRIISSLFSFLPVYYKTDCSVISNKWEMIVPYSGAVVDELFLIESHLFNYPIGEHTLYSDITLMESFSMMDVQRDSLHFIEIENVKSWFSAQVEPSIDLKQLSKQFIHSCRKYFDSPKELITFTSGFDGRTILANAMAASKSVQTFSMGRMENDDVYNPRENAEELNIPFDIIDLGGEEYQQHFIHAASRMCSISGGRNGFLYPHFYFCSEQYRDFRVLHTGYCGSELFRALHIAGAVTSKELVSIFLEDDDEKLKDIIFQSNRLKFFRDEMIERNAEKLWENILAIRAMRNGFSETNHFFYYFIFKEVFRKVFGFWTATQFENIKVRTPFLDFDFVQLLLKSEFAGCNNVFFTHNPLKRYKGQLLYAQILKDLNSPLYTMMTGKQYTPRQLLSIFGQLSIIIPYLKKKWKKKKGIQNIDNLGLITGYQQAWAKENLGNRILENYYDAARIHAAFLKVNPYMLEVERDMLFQIASLSLTLKDDETCGAHRL